MEPDVARTVDVDWPVEAGAGGTAELRKKSLVRIRVETRTWLADRLARRHVRPRRAGIYDATPKMLLFAPFSRLSVGSYPSASLWQFWNRRSVTFPIRRRLDLLPLEALHPLFLVPPPDLETSQWDFRALLPDGKVVEFVEEASELFGRWVATVFVPFPHHRQLIDGMKCHP